jgi:ankyrin repeat protein
MVAAGRGYTAVVEQLVNLGANINIKASNDWTAVYLAQKFRYSKFIGQSDCKHVIKSQIKIIRFEGLDIHYH